MESIDKSLECVLEKNTRPWGYSNSTWSLNFVITIMNQFYLWTHGFAWQQRVMWERERESESKRAYDGYSFIVVWLSSINTLLFTLEFLGYQNLRAVTLDFANRFWFNLDSKFQNLSLFHFVESCNCKKIYNCAIVLSLT